MEFLKVHEQSVSDGDDLRGDGRQHRHINTVKLVKAPPCAALTQPGEDLTHGLKHKWKGLCKGVGIDKIHHKYL